MTRTAIAFMRTVTLSALLVMVLAAAAIPQQLNGKGEWHSLSSTLVQGRWTAALVRQGSHVRGTLSLTGSNVLSGGEATGEIDGSDIILGVMVQGTRQASFSGQLEGESVKGEWKLASDVVTDHGVWTGKLRAAKADQNAEAQE